MPSSNHSFFYAKVVGNTLLIGEQAFSALQLKPFEEKNQEINFFDSRTFRSCNPLIIWFNKFDICVSFLVFYFRQQNLCIQIFGTSSGTISAFHLFFPITYQFQNSMEFKKVNFSLKGLVVDVPTTQKTNLEILPNKKWIHNKFIDTASDSPASVVMPVIMIDTTTVEDQILNLTKIVEGQVVHAQGQNGKIVNLMVMIKNIGENNLGMSK